MHKFKSISKKWIAGSLMSGFVLAGCGSGTSNPASAGSVDSQGATTLPNGAQLSGASGTVLLESGKMTRRELTLAGGSSVVDLKLNAIVTPLQGTGADSASSGSGLKVSIQNPDLQTGETSSTEVELDASSVTQGNYRVQFVAANLPGNPIVGTFYTSVANTNMVKASYVQLSATGSLLAITASGYNLSNIIIFAFADPTTSQVDGSYLAAMQTAINNEPQGSLNFISLGGQFGLPSNFSNISQVVSNVASQIQSYNSQLKGGSISGVDLDLEGDFSPDQIQQLAQGFKAQGLLVSVAPQVYNTGSNVVASSDPSNLVLTAGSPGSNLNTYGPAIAGGNVDYIFAQTYNTGNWTVDGVSEANVQFFTAIANALNNSVKEDCSGNLSVGSSLCIPQGTQIVIGEVSNARAATNANSIFGSDGATPYNQAGVLSQLASRVTSVLQNDRYISGVMQWSLNNDYMPTGWGDSYASVGAFSTVIFGGQ